jgi:hypothetical protein
MMHLKDVQTDKKIAPTWTTGILNHIAITVFHNVLD